MFNYGSDSIISICVLVSSFHTDPDIAVETAKVNISLVRNKISVTAVVILTYPLGSSVAAGMV